MDSVTLFLLACGLAMDAFAVSLSNGLCYHNFRRSQAALSAVTFGIFQAIMPVIGYFAGRFFSEAISSVDHWIAFYPARADWRAHASGSDQGNPAPGGLRREAPLYSADFTRTGRCHKH